MNVHDLFALHWWWCSCVGAPFSCCFGVSLHGSKMHRLQVIQGSIAPSSTGKLQGNGHQHNYRHFFQMVNFLSEDREPIENTPMFWMNPLQSQLSTFRGQSGLYTVSILMGMANMDWHTQIQQEYIPHVHFRFLNLEMVFSLRRGLSFLQ